MMLGTFPSRANTFDNNRAKEKTCHSDHIRHKSVCNVTVTLCRTDLQSADSFLISNYFIQLQRSVFFNPGNKNTFKSQLFITVRMRLQRNELGSSASVHKSAASLSLATLKSFKHHNSRLSNSHKQYHGSS